MSAPTDDQIIEACARFEGWRCWRNSRPGSGPAADIAVQSPDDEIELSAYADIWVEDFETRGGYVELMKGIPAYLTDYNAAARLRTLAYQRWGNLFLRRVDDQVPPIEGEFMEIALWEPRHIATAVWSLMESEQ